MIKDEVPEKVKRAIEEISSQFSIIDMKAYYETEYDGDGLVKKFVSHQVSYRRDGVRYDTVVRLEA